MDSQFIKRCAQLRDLEMHFNGEGFIGSEFYNDDFNVHHSEIACDTPEQWDKKISTLTSELENRTK